MNYLEERMVIVVYQFGGENAALIRRVDEKISSEPKTL